VPRRREIRKKELVGTEESRLQSVKSAQDPTDLQLFRGQVVQKMGEEEKVFLKHGKRGGEGGLKQT